jgi:hypothetical protein
MRAQIVVVALTLILAPVHVLAPVHAQAADFVVWLGKGLL